MSEGDKGAPVEAPQPPMDGLGEYEQHMAWDMQRQAYIYEDMDSGAIYMWDQTNEKWILDESSLYDDVSHEDSADSVKNNDDMNIETPTISNSTQSKDGNARSEDGETTNETRPPEEGEAGDSQAQGESQAVTNGPLKKKRKRRNKTKPTNTLYITGLPSNVTEVELMEFCKKAGIVAKDPYTLEYRLKIYRNEDGTAKGDGLVTYLKVLSIPQAFQILDGADLRPGNGGYPIKLEMAKFEQKATKEKKVVNPNKRKKRYNQEEAELGWEEKDQKHVIIKYMFDPEEASKDDSFYDKLREDIEEEFERMGPVDSLKVFEKHPEGVVAVKYGSSLAAQKCIEIMDGRWFDGRRLNAEFYDGYSNYSVVETDEEKAKRDKNWAKWLIGNEQYEEENL